MGDAETDMDTESDEENKAGGNTDSETDGLKHIMKCEHDQRHG